MSCVRWTWSPHLFTCIYCQLATAIWAEVHRTAAQTRLQTFPSPALHKLSKPNTVHHGWPVAARVGRSWGAAFGAAVCIGNGTYWACRQPTWITTISGPISWPSPSSRCSTSSAPGSIQSSSSMALAISLWATLGDVRAIWLSHQEGVCNVQGPHLREGARAIY